MHQFVQIGTVAGAAGGALLGLGAGLQAVTTDEPFSAYATSEAFAVSAGLRWVGTLLLIWGMVALYLRVAHRTGRWTIAATVAVVANLVLQMGWMFSDLFVAPVLAEVAPQVLDGDTPSRLGVGFLLAWLMNTTFVVLGVALLRARALPRAVGACLVVAGAVTLAPLPFDGPVYEVVIGAALAVACLAARGQRHDSAPSLQGATAAHQAA